MLSKTRILLLVISLVAVFTLLIGCTPPSPTPTPTPADEFDMVREVAISKANAAGNNIPTTIANWARETIPASMPGGTVTVKFHGVSNGDWYVDVSYTSGLAPENTNYNVTIQFDGLPAIWTGIVTHSEILFY